MANMIQDLISRAMNQGMQQSQMLARQQMPAAQQPQQMPQSQFMLPGGMNPQSLSMLMQSMLRSRGIPQNQFTPQGGMPLSMLMRYGPGSGGMFSQLPGMLQQTAGRVIGRGAV